MWLIGRTLVDGPDDLAAVSEPVSRYRSTPSADERARSAVIEGPVESPHTIGAAGIGFFDELCRALETVRAVITQVKAIAPAAAAVPLDRQEVVSELRGRQPWPTG